MAENSAVMRLEGRLDYLKRQMPRMKRVDEFEKILQALNGEMHNKLSEIADMEAAMPVAQDEGSVPSF